MQDKRKINKFALKWLKKYQSEKTTEREVEEKFADECFSFGFEIDCGNALLAEFPNTDAFNNYEELEKIIDQIEDIAFLGSAIFSKWRYITHWAEEDLIKIENRRWFVLALSQLVIISTVDA